MQPWLPSCVFGAIIGQITCLKGDYMSTTVRAPIETMPIFQQNFGKFFEFLQARGTSRPAISPERFALATSVDLKTLARNAHVHRNTISRAPESESIQNYLRESLRAIRAATDIAGSVESAIYWFRNNPLPVFDYKTAEMLVSEGRTDALIKYIQSLQAGFAG